jgi:hypothetical protein
MLVTVCSVVEALFPWCGRLLTFGKKRSLICCAGRFDVQNMSFPFRMLSAPYFGGQRPSGPTLLLLARLGGPDPRSAFPDDCALLCLRASGRPVVPAGRPGRSCSPSSSHAPSPVVSESAGAGQLLYTCFLLSLHSPSPAHLKGNMSSSTVHHKALSSAYGEYISQA